MGKTISLVELKKMAVAKDMPLGITEAPFERIDYREDEDGNITGCFAHFEGYKSIYMPFTNGEINYQLDYLLEQLGVESYDPDEIAKTAGTIVKISRYEKETSRDMSAPELTAFKAKFEGTPPTYIEIVENTDGTATVKSTFINSNFNLKTIK